ncbi:hypothetical protein CEXT_302911 [Caerostris extrusa]|uniref:Uncharacterized protein n=1 Tax=Caerostris extrusa TaxID=172846 RepID=A0AAV4V3D3_CAEEX|nr:hypothetical protein CEXT_302911 [Caerostris extrusa]
MLGFGYTTPTRLKVSTLPEDKGCESSRCPTTCAMRLQCNWHPCDAPWNFSRQLNLSVMEQKDFNKCLKSHFYNQKRIFFVYCFWVSVRKLRLKSVAKVTSFGARLSERLDLMPFSILLMFALSPFGAS